MFLLRAAEDGDVEGDVEGDDNVLPIIPTSTTPMSEITYATLSILVGVIIMGAGALIWWVKREISRIDHRIDGHDNFVCDTKDVLTNVQVDIASIKATISSMDHSLGDLAKSNRDVIKYMMENK